MFTVSLFFTVCLDKDASGKEKIARLSAREIKMEGEKYKRIMRDIERAETGESNTERDGFHKGLDRAGCRRLKWWRYFTLK